MGMNLGISGIGSNANSGATGGIRGNTGFQVIQPDKNGPFQIVQPAVVPTSKRTNTNQNTTTNRVGSQTKYTDQNRVQSTAGRKVTDKLDPKSRTAYNSLLSALQSGGTDTMKKGMAALEALLGRSEDAEDEYTVDAARSQAQKSIPKYARALRENVMPSITSAQESAGLSGDTITALLAQDATTRLSESAAAAELEAIKAYGDLSQSQQQITAGTASEIASDPVTAALQQLMELGSQSYEDTRTSEVIKEIIKGTEKTDFNEVSNEQITGNESENIGYQSYGGGNSGSGSNSRMNMGSASGEDDSAEKTALLLSMLGPFQNMQDLAYYQGGASAGVGGMGQARYESGKGIANLMKLLKV